MDVCVLCTATAITSDVQEQNLFRSSALPGKILDLGLLKIIGVVFLAPARPYPNTAGQN